MVRPLIEVLGRKVWDMGENSARANAAKIAANMMVTMAIEALAEGRGTDGSQRPATRVCVLAAEKRCCTPAAPGVHGAAPVLPGAAALAPLSLSEVKNGAAARVRC